MNLLAIIELGGYPDFSAMYKAEGFTVTVATSMRKALRHIKQKKPDVIVVEFNFQSDFRDRTSNLESLMAVVQPLPDVKVIVFYEKEYLHQYEKIKSRFNIAYEFEFPVNETDFKSAIVQCAMDISA